MGAVITSEAELWLVWWLCSSAKARRNSVIRKNLKELKWSRAGSCCTLLLLIAKPRLSPPLGSADHTCKNSQHLVSIFSIWNCWSRRGTQERGVTSLGAGGPMETLLSPGGDFQAPCPGAKCYWKTNIDFWQSLEKFMLVFPRVYELTRNGDKS